MTSMHADVRKEHQRFAERHVKRARGGAAKKVEEGVHEHEDHMHPGKKKTKLKLRRGGHVKGEHPKDRLDRRARGGSLGGGKKKGNVAVIVHAGGDENRAKQEGIQQGLQLGRLAGARQAMAMRGGQAPPPARPPMPPGQPGLGGPPGGAPGMPPAQALGGPRPMPNGPMPGALASGGKVDGVREVAGGRSGEERYEKELGKDLVPVKAHTRRRRGGACD